MKKRILFMLASIIAFTFCFGSLTCFATELTESPSPSVSTSAETSPAAESATPTLSGRILEYCTENKTELIGLAGDALILALGLVIRNVFKKRTKAIASDLSIVKGDAAGTASAQTSVVGAVNNMIDGYNEMRTSYEKYEAVEDDRNRLVGAVMVQNTAILDILSTVYVNSKNLPQGVKDLVTLKYVNCQKALGNDDVLRSVVEAVQEKINVAATADDETEANKLSPSDNVQTDTPEELL